jgi:hypothetical protein
MSDIYNPQYTGSHSTLPDLTWAYPTAGSSRVEKRSPAHNRHYNFTGFVRAPGQSGEH